jgi:glycosyltransferase involved in cell wall biosynthesis
MVATRRFAFVSPNYYPLTCGVGDHSMRLGRELLGRGYEVTVFTHDPVQPNPEAPEVSVQGVPGTAALALAERIRARVAAYAPTDLVIQYTAQMLGASRWGSVALPWLAAWARRAGIKVVLLAHELFLPWNRRPDLALGAAMTRAQLMALMKLADRTLVTMETRIAELAPFTRALGLPDPGVVRIGSNALPLPPVSQPGRLRLGLFSTLASTKRFDVVLDCFAEVQRRRPEAELVILGDLGDERRARVSSLREAVARHPAAQRIRVPGRLELQEVAREVAALDVYIFPMISGANTRSGTLPLALGTGLPVVAINGYETDALFVDGENVIYASALTGAAFGEAVLRVVDDPALRQRVSSGARRLYDEHFAWGRVADRFLAQI